MSLIKKNGKHKGDIIYFKKSVRITKEASKIEERQTMQCPNRKKRQNDNQCLQNTTQQIKDLTRRTIRKPGAELRCSRRVSRSCFTSGTRRIADKRQEHHIIWESGTRNI